MADRYGRRLPLMINIGVFAVAEILTGLAPNYTVLLIVRALFGIVMGGQWGVGASLAMEGAPCAGAACSPDCCNKATRPATCWLRFATSSSSVMLGGGRCFFRRAARHPARYSSSASA